MQAFGQSSRRRVEEQERTDESAKQRPYRAEDGGPVKAGLAAAQDVEPGGLDCDGPSSWTADAISLCLSQGKPTSGASCCGG